MGESLQEQARQVSTATSMLQIHVTDQEWLKAKYAAREILSLASKMYQRLAVLVDIDADARAMAAVDRAVAAAGGQVPGPRTFADELKRIGEKKPAPKPKPAPRKRKGE